MSNANPRTEGDPASTAADPDTQQGSASSTSTATEPSEANTEHGGEQQLERSIEERYEELEERYDQLRDQLEDYNRSAQEFIQDHPGLSVAAALGTGYIIGRLAANRWLK